MSPPRLGGRACIALLTTFSFVVLVVTGVVLYVEPHGRVAYWTDWRLLGLGKQHWDGVHIVSASLFLVAACAHTYLNWRPLVRYVAGKTRHGARRTRELAAALVTVVLFAVGAGAGWQPFQSLLDLNEHAKSSWGREPGRQPPFGHAELLPVASLCRKEGIELASALENLRAHGIEVADERQILRDVARHNGLTPEAVYRIMGEGQTPGPRSGGGRITRDGGGEVVGDGGGPGGRRMGARRGGGQRRRARLAESPGARRLFRSRYAGSGLGRKTVGGLCAELGLDAERGLSDLRSQGIPAAAHQTVRAVALAASRRPADVLAALCRSGECR